MEKGIRVFFIFQYVSLLTHLKCSVNLRIGDSMADDQAWLGILALLIGLFTLVLAHVVITVYETIKELLK